MRSIPWTGRFDAVVSWFTAGRANARRTIIRHGRARHSSFFTRLFSFTELRDWLHDAGFHTVEGYAGDGTPLTATARRMISSHVRSARDRP
jgi:hypothetical protein